MHTLELVIEKNPQGKKRDQFFFVTYPTFIVRIEKINALMINSRRRQIMVTISKHFGDVFTSLRHPGQSTYLKAEPGRGGSGKSINPVSDLFSIKY